MGKLKKIIVDRGQTQEIARYFNVSPQTVRMALRYSTEGDRPDRIREYAIKIGGIHKTKIV